jgi:hypothetical protein
VVIEEEERRADDMAAVRHPDILRLAARCIVDDDRARADAAEMAAACEALRAASRAAPTMTLIILHVERSRRDTRRLDPAALVWGLAIN